VCAERCAQECALLLLACILQERVCPGNAFCSAIVQGTHHMARAHHARLVSMLQQQQLQFWPMHKAVTVTGLRVVLCRLRSGPLAEVEGAEGCRVQILPLCVTVAT
jgi:hypothetical protein